MLWGPDKVKPKLFAGLQLAGGAGECEKWSKSCKSKWGQRLKRENTQLER